MMFPNKKQKTASCENYKFNILNEEQKIQILGIYAFKSDDDSWKTNGNPIPVRKHEKPHTETRSNLISGEEKPLFKKLRSRV